MTRVRSESHNFRRLHNVKQQQYRLIRTNNCSTGNETKNPRKDSSMSASKKKCLVRTYNFVLLMKIFTLPSADIEIGRFEGK